MAGYRNRISSRIYVSTCTKMVSSDMKPFSVDHTTMTSDLAFDLQSLTEFQMPDQRSLLWCCVICSGKLAVVCNHLCTRADVISTQYPIPRLLTLNLTVKAKCQVKGYGCVSCSGRLAIAWDLFVTRARVIPGRYWSVSRSLTLNLTLKVKWNLTSKVIYQFKGHDCVGCKGWLAVFWDHLGTGAYYFGTISGTSSFYLEVDL